MVDYLVFEDGKGGLCSWRIPKNPTTRQYMRLVRSLKGSGVAGGVVHRAKNKAEALDIAKHCLPLTLAKMPDVDVELVVSSN